MGDQLIYGRVFMADSLAFHILFALFGVGIPLLVCLAELWSLLGYGTHYKYMARQWSYIMSVLFVGGALSGTIVAVLLILLWPGFIAVAGKIISLPFYLEVIAFFLEAIFLGIYIFTWDRFKSLTHWLCSLPMLIGSTGSAFFITTVNAFMNNPQGFYFNDNHDVVGIHPIEAMFNPATPTETVHSILSYYLATALCFAAFYAFLFLREHHQEVKKYYHSVIIFLMMFCVPTAVMLMYTGDASTQYIARYEPVKFAAAENLTKTQAFAPLDIFGIKIPGLLSVLTFHDFRSIILGLDTYDGDQLPPPIVHGFYETMALGGVFISIVVFMFALLYLLKRKRENIFSRAMLIAIMISAVISLYCVEAGWMVTELGRQPYVIANIMTTEEAFTSSPYISVFGFSFPILYIILAAVTVWILIRYYKASVHQHL